MSDDKPAADTFETLLSLQNKHPHPGVAYNHLPPDNVIHKALQVHENDILRAIRFFPERSSGGPDGLPPQHVLEMVTCREAGAELVMAITKFTNALLDGRCHSDVVPILLGGSLIALQKKSGGVRPIAIGYTWRRLVAKCANLRRHFRTHRPLQPESTWRGVPRGSKAAVHAARR